MSNTSQDALAVGEDTSGLTFGEPNSSGSSILPKPSNRESYPYEDSEGDAADVYSAAYRYWLWTGLANAAAWGSAIHGNDGGGLCRL